MALIANLILLALVSAPQEQGETHFLLSKSERASLAKKAKAWLEASVEYQRALKDKDRERAMKNERPAKDAFMKEWDARIKKKKLLASMPDLEEIFADVFPYPRQSAYGELKHVAALHQEGAGDIAGYTLSVPRGYNFEKSYRAVLLLPGYDSTKSDWDSAKETFEQSWKDSALMGDTIFAIPELDRSLLMDPIPELTKDVDQTNELRRNKILLSALGQVKRDYHLDGDRLILDCGRETCGYGLRLATAFPSLFAGVVLRWPVDTGNLRLDSLAGIPVMIVSSAKTKEAAAKIEQALNKAEPGHCKVIEAKDAYPFPGSKDEIATWAQTVKRDLFRTKVVLAPNQDSWLRTYWVVVTKMEPIENVAEAERPLLIVEADRAANRLNIQARNIEKFSLLLNDALLDLDKEITTVINGKATTCKQQRSLEKLCELLIYKFDPRFLFTTELMLDVPAAPVNAGSKPDKSAGDAKDEKKAEGGNGPGK